jgi:hypothetical protein
MNDEIHDLQILAVRSLAQRGLTRAPGAFAFVYKGQKVKVAIEASVYRGYFVTVYDGLRPTRQFRACYGAYDWNAIAAHIIEVAERKIAPLERAPTPAQFKNQNRRLADELSTITGAGPNSPLSIQPSPSAPGLVRFRLDEVDLDPVSVIQIYAAVSRAAQQQPPR